MFDELFENIGTTVKKTAVALLVAGLILSLIAGFGTFVFACLDDDTLWYAPMGIVGGLVGCAASWVSCITLYAFGELVEDTHALRNKEGTTAEVQAKRKAQEQAAYQEAETKNKGKKGFFTIEPAAFDEEFVDVMCPRCKAALSFMKDSDEVVCPECGSALKIQ